MKQTDQQGTILVASLLSGMVLIFAGLLHVGGIKGLALAGVGIFCAALALFRLGFYVTPGEVRRLTGNVWRLLLHPLFLLYVVGFFGPELAAYASDTWKIPGAITVGGVLITLAWLSYRAYRNERNLVPRDD